MTDNEKKDDRKITFCPVDDINKNPLSKKECDVYYSSPFNFAGVFTGSIWNDCYGVIYIIIDTNKDKSLDSIKVYIGQTIQILRKRFYDDLNSPSNKYLKEAIERYNKKFKIFKIDNNHYRTKGGEFTIEVIKKLFEELKKNFIKD